MPPDKDQKKDDDGLSRRQFLRFAWGSAARKASEAIADTTQSMEEALAVARPRYSPIVRVGTVAELNDLAVGTVVDRFAESEHFFLVKTPNGWLALNNRCTHASGLLTWELPAEDQKDGKFLCSNDESTYDAHGEAISGPAPYPLDTLAIESRDDIVYVMTDTANPRVSVDPESDPTDV